MLCVDEAITQRLRDLGEFALQKGKEIRQTRANLSTEVSECL